jgi:NADH dehydrogenase/putative oxidoreductase
MLILSLVIQFSYQALDQHLFWAILFGWFVVKGAGPISLDALIGRGIAATALPLAGTITRIFEALSRCGDPAIKLLLRCWIAALFFRSGVMKISNFDMTQMLFHAQSAQGLLPPRLAARLTILIELACLVFLVLGAGTRITAIVLIGLSALVDPTYQQSIDLAYYLMVLALIALHGPGALSIDNLVVRALRRRFPGLRVMPRVSCEGLPRVLIVGGGFGGVAAAKALRNTSCRVTLVDQRNYYLFQPLLYQVATAGLSPADIAGPIRGLFRDQPNVRVLLGGVTAIDVGAREVIMRDVRVPYDYLVIAAGARHSYFGHDEWAPFAPGLKQIEDATNIRSRLLFAFEQAENAEAPALRREMLTFVIVGGGPTGVELAGALAEIARQSLPQDFRSIRPESARIVLVEGSPDVLPAFPEALRQAARRSLEQLGVEMRTGSVVTAVDEAGVSLGAELIAAQTVLWAAGVAASPLATSLGVPVDRMGRLTPQPTLALAEYPEIFVAGDLCAFTQDGAILPGVAQVAMQEGAQAARNVLRTIRGERLESFRYRDYGIMATIGRGSAVGDIFGIKISGFLGWIFWLFLHIFWLIGFRNRIVVMTEWAWSYFTMQRRVRLITGERLWPQ